MLTHDGERGEVVAERGAGREDNFSEKRVTHLPQTESVEAAATTTVRVSNKILSTDVGIVKIDDVWESVERGKGEGGACDGVEEANAWGIVEGDEPAVRGTADAREEGEVGVGEEVGLVGGEVEEGRGKREEEEAWWELGWEMMERGFGDGGSPATTYASESEVIAVQN